MDKDLEAMSREQLTAEVRRLRDGIWSLLPEKTDPLPVVPAWPQFMQGCIHDRQSLERQAPAAPRTTRRYGQ